MMCEAGVDISLISELTTQRCDVGFRSHRIRRRHLVLRLWIKARRRERCMEELQVLRIRLAPDEALRPRSTSASVRARANALLLCVLCAESSRTGTLTTRRRSTLEISQRIAACAMSARARLGHHSAWDYRRDISCIE